MYEENLNTKETNELFIAISKLKTDKEVKKFMRDLCTFSEIQTFTERWRVAQLIDKDIPYRKISEKTGSSTATITRVAKWLHHGMGGYRLMLDRLSKK
jgi:TrpR-related protein YerC/YecD